MISEHNEKEFFYCTEKIMSDLILADENRRRMINTKNTTQEIRVCFMAKNIEKTTNQNIGWIYKEPGLQME